LIYVQKDESSGKYINYLRKDKQEYQIDANLISAS